jgi:hypothetical protein
MKSVTSPAPLAAGSLAADPAIRGAAAVGLVTVGVIHALEIQGQLSGAAWLTAGFVLLAAGAPLAALWLLVRPGAPSWALAFAVGLAAAAGYILTRSVAVPGDPGDRGNWLEPLGLAALIIEPLIAILAALALAGLRRAGGRAALNTAQQAAASV